MNSAVRFQKVFEHCASHCDYSLLGGSVEWGLWPAREKPVEELGYGSWRPGSVGIPGACVRGELTGGPEAGEKRGFEACGGAGQIW